MVRGGKVGVLFPCTRVCVFLCVQNPSLGGTAASRLPESLQTVRLGTAPQGWSWSLTAPSCAEQAYAFSVLGGSPARFELKISTALSQLYFVLQSVQPRGKF